jgi:G3E family GTPase
VTRTPVHVVTGAPASRASLVARLLAAQPGWARLLPGGCPCCTGRVETRVALVRLLRETRPERVLLELTDEAHLASLQRALGEWPLARYVELGRVITLPQDSALAPETLGS